ncbi:MAG: NADH:ubiquinone oxidoreductase subunit NDUFA12 [Holosporales bacterium]|jgi:NADH:ubiquinone oxidoreductase subunit
MDFSRLGTQLKTWWRGQYVGADGFGNRFFKDKQSAQRWVLFKGLTEASKVPPEWQAWLTHTESNVPQSEKHRHAWQKPHLPNLTGTVHAYCPSGDLGRGGHRPHATGDYQAWNPPAQKTILSKRNEP